ncbi:MAG: polyprenyl synthetase family protein [Muribaculaceae bacterium]|nr:polyprenyl synthetase family protein [Muribaculaceae bacterium]
MKRISEYAMEVEECLRELKINEMTPASLYEPVAYAMEAGGKRIRPALVLMTAEAFGLDGSGAMPAALGLELFHNFTLLHDDVMDKSDMRRNRETVVKRFGEDAAILSGDAMLGLAEEMFLGVDADKYREVAKVYVRMAKDVYAGQALDMEFEKRSDVGVDEYVEMIRLKTGALLGACAEIGGILAGVNEKQAALLRSYGENLGIAFQIEDDWLDTFGDAATFGKPIGGDINNNKKTFLMISGLNEGGEQGKALCAALELPAGETKVKTVTRIYEMMGLDELGRKEALKYSAAALKAVKKTGLGEKELESFKYLVDRLSGRKA